MLPLYGTATGLRGFDHGQAWEVIRVRAPDQPPEDEDDAAIIQSATDAATARAAGHAKAIAIGEASDLLDEQVSPFDVLAIPTRYNYLADGDILGFQASTRRFRVLYRRSSAHNSFLVTERCNHYCLMCSQPPRDVNDGWLLDEIGAALRLVDPSTKSFAFTGGEPLLEWRGFVRLLEQCRDVLPSTAVHVLTNGRGFASSEIASAWASINHPQLMAGIPIYSAVDCVHDYVVQAQGALDETVLGILRLKERGQRVEVRVVLHAITAPRIVETCRWLARNLPFVDHVALMGLENTGFALANDDLLWIDPIEYKDDLASAVDHLASTGINVSVYNLPRCLLARSVWPFAVQSISDWKNGYLPECASCVVRDDCSGFFTSGRPRHSPSVSPILVA